MIDTGKRIQAIIGTLLQAAVLLNQDRASAPGAQRLADAQGQLVGLRALLAPRKPAQKSMRRSK